MRYKITVSGNLETWADEDTVRADFPMFAGSLEAVHPGIVRGSATLVSVEALPEVESAEDTVEIDPTAVASNTAAILATLNALNARLDRAGI
jgi:hypothetical protein